MSKRKYLYLTNSMIGFVIALRKEDGTLIFKERIDKKINGYSKTSLSKITTKTLNKLKERNIKEIDVIIDGIKEEFNVKYVIDRLLKKGFILTDIKIKTTLKINGAVLRRSKVRVEWNTIQDKIKNMEKDGNTFFEVVGIELGGLMMTENKRRLENEGYLVRTTTMRNRVKYVVIKE